MITAAGQDATPDIALAKINYAYVWLVSCAGALGGLLFGYDWVVIGGAKPFYEVYFRLGTPALQGWAMSCALLGCLIGAVMAGQLSERFGRKPPLLVAALVFAVSSLGTALADSFASFVVWRLLGGVAIGLASGLSPMYIAEVAPARQRGRLVSLNQFTIVIGILLAQIVNWKIARPVPAGATAAMILNSWNGQTGWRMMFGITVIPAVFFLLAMLFVPESPRWLAQAGRKDAAAKVLARIGGSDYAQAMLAQMASVPAHTEGSEIRALLEDRKLRRIFILGIILAVLQQWCGINIVFTYAQEIFSAAGYQVSDILFNIVVTGAVNVLFTCVAFAIVDRAGRRVLMLIGSSGLAIIYTVLGILYAMHHHGVLMLALVVAAIGCYAMSLAPVTWVLIAEIFPDRVRGVAVSATVAILWIASFAVTYAFPFMNQMLGAGGTFGVFALICAAGFIYISFKLPETRQRSLEEIEKSWGS